MARKKKQEEHVNHERWLVSYADFITLLFATFTALFAISTVDRDKLQKMHQSVGEALKSPTTHAIAPRVIMDGGGSSEGDLVISIFPDSAPAAGQGAAAIDPAALQNLDPSSVQAQVAHMAEATPTPTPTPTPSNELAAAEGMGNEKMVAELMSIMENAGLDREVELRQETRGTVISLGSAAFFAPGGIDVLPASMHKLDKVINVLRTRNLNIRIEGHTDDTPVRSGRFRNNRELSALRASRIVDFMVENYDYNPTLLSSAGYGEWHPIADNDTHEGRQKNRRVDIVILNEAHSMLEPG